MSSPEKGLSLQAKVTNSGFQKPTTFVVLWLPTRKEAHWTSGGVRCVDVSGPEITSLAQASLPSAQANGALPLP